MTEILTESFCERCGTRYTFEPAAPRRKPLRAIGTLGRGLRHFVSDPGSTIDEAMAVARSEQEQRSTANALEAFHRTFNFCLSCRQYTCADCWNPVEGRCLSCAPTPEAAPPVARADTPVSLHAVAAPPMSMAPAAVPVLDGQESTAPDAEAAETAAREAAAQEAAEAEAAAAEAAALAAAEAAATREAAERAAAEEAAERAAAELLEAEARAEAEAEAAAAAERMAAVAAEAAEAAEAARVAAEEESTRAAAQEEAERVAAEEARLRAEAEAEAAAQAEAAAVAESLARAEAAELAAREAAEERMRIEEAALAETAAETGPAALTFEPGFNLDDEIAAYEANQVGAPAETEPEGEAPVDEPGMVAPAPEPIPTAIGRPIPASVADAAPPAWPDPDAAAAAFEPHWPDVPVARSAAQDTPTPALDEVPGVPAPVVHGGARACPSCGLSLSASARFCRRCGTPQQVDAPR